MEMPSESPFQTFHAYHKSDKQYKTQSNKNEVSTNK